MNIMEATIIFLSLFIGIINGNLIGSTENVSTCGNTTCHPIKINGHIVPRSHDDIGIYYQLQHIISSVGSASRENHNRRFKQVATSIFFTWWNEHDELIKSQMRQLINEGRLEIVNGSLSMNDEGAVHYQSSINQYTLGLRFIEDTLRKYARLSVSWQIDAFGHGRRQASLTSQLGMGAALFARLDYRDKRQKEKSLHRIWTRSDNLGTATAMNTAIATAVATGTGPVTVTKTTTDPGAGAATATATASGTARATATATTTGAGAVTATATASGTATATATATAAGTGVAVATATGSDASAAMATASGTAAGVARATATGTGTAAATARATSTETGATVAVATASGTAAGTARATSRGAGAATATATGSAAASATAIATATAGVAATATATATDHDVIEEITT